MCDVTPAQLKKSSFARQHEAVSSDVAMDFDIGNTPIRTKANIIESYLNGYRCDSGFLPQFTAPDTLSPALPSHSD